MRNHRSWFLAWGILVFAPVARGEPLPAQRWDYVPAMRKVVARGPGRPGVVLHVGDSITYANPYGQWARMGRGKTPDDEAVLRWMHCGRDDETDGWWLCRFDHPSGGRSHTAASGIRADQMLAGGYRGLPALDEMLSRYRPQIVVLMLGTNDASAARSLADYRADMERAVKTILDAGAISILSTIPPHPRRTDLAQSYNVALREIAEAKRLPLIDFEREILRRRPDDWNGTLLGAGDVHPTAAVGEVRASSEPTPENLGTSGYLLRGWLSMKKISEVKRRVLDADPAGGKSPSRRGR